MTLSKTQRNHIRLAFGWHSDYITKLNTERGDRKGTTWQQCRKFRDDELELAGIKNLFEDDYELVS